jgi:hypothetical protein
VLAADGREPGVQIERRKRYQRDEEVGFGGHGRAY